MGTKLRIEVASAGGARTVAQLAGGAKARHSFFRGSKKKRDKEEIRAALEAENDGEEELARSPSLGEITSTTDTRRLEFQKQMERVKSEERISAREGKEESTWSQLRRTPFPEGLLKKLQQTADKAAAELIGSLLTKSAFATLSELTRNTVAMEQLDRRGLAI